MIEIRLKEIANQLGKNVSDIARETGLNRNTVTSLYHNQVDGIKFATIDLLCDTYGIKLQDLVVRREMQIGGAPGSKIVREARSESPFFSWMYLNALHVPSPQYFKGGAGKIYAFFVRDTAELYFDRREISRVTHLIHDEYARSGLDEVHSAFTRTKDQLSASIAGIVDQPLARFVSTDLAKTARRMSALFADVLATSAWIDLYDFGVREEIVRHAEQVNGLTASESSILLASGENTPAITRRIAFLSLARSAGSMKQREFEKFLREYPFVSAIELANDLSAYAAHPNMTERELDELTRLSRRHGQAVTDVLRKHNMRINPLEFFARLAAWREEREETDRATRFQLKRLLQTIAERSRIKPSLIHYLLPQEIDHAVNGLVTDATLQRRHDSGMMLALEHNGYHVYEGEYAVSVQDDLISRYTNQLFYGDL